MSEAAAGAVRAMIIEGELAPGARINEVRLSQSLGLSRTPLREALARLANEGALTAAPGRGFFVRPLTLVELEQVYAIRPLLDPEALRLAGVPSGQRINRLERLNGSLARARDPYSVIAHDDEWHLELLAGCPNRVLIELIENFMLRTRRYELALMRETKNLAVATDDHARILSALRQDDLKAACAALKHNLESGLKPIVDWIKARA